MSATTSLPLPPMRGVLLADAATCLAMGLALLAATGVLAPRLELPAPLLAYAGLILLPTAAFLGWTATRERIPRWAVLAVILGNAAWMIASAALLFGPWVAPNLLGKAFIVVQAGAVGVLTAIEYGALRHFGYGD